MYGLIEKLLTSFYDSGTQADDAKYHLEVDFGTLRKLRDQKESGGAVGPECVATGVIGHQGIADSIQTPLNYGVLTNRQVAYLREQGIVSSTWTRLNCGFSDVADSSPTIAIDNRSINTQFGLIFSIGGNLVKFLVNLDSPDVIPKHFLEEAQYALGLSANHIIKSKPGVVVHKGSFFKLDPYTSWNQLGNKILSYYSIGDQN